MVDARSADFREVIEYFGTVPLIPTPLPPSMNSLAKRVHESTYTLILWRFRLTNLPPHAQPFVDEISSDALQVLPQILLGYTRATKLLLRGILENTLRFVYFYDHPVEFALMNQQAKWYLELKQLFYYVKSHPNHKIAETKFDAINKMQSLYSELSAGVHGRTVRDLESRTALRSIIFNLAEARKELGLLQRCTEAVNFVLAIENRVQLRSFPADDKGYILGSLPKFARLAWQDFEGVISRE